MSTRRRFTPAFKARAALDALRGNKTSQEIATRYRDANAFPRDPALALYWFLRAAQQGTDVRAEIATVAAELSPDAVEKIEKDVANKHVPQFR